MPPCVLEDKATDDHRMVECAEVCVRACVRVRKTGALLKHIYIAHPPVTGCDVSDGFSLGFSVG